MVFMGSVGGRNGDLGDLALDGEGFLGSKGAEIGQVQFNDGVAEGGEVRLGYGHNRFLCCKPC